MGCGYNLRGLLASARCPECNLAIEGSLSRLKRPVETAGALRTLAWSYVGLLGLLPLIPAILTSSLGLLWLGLAVLVVACIFRALAVAELRYFAGLEHSPTVGRPLAALWFLSLFELALSVCSPSWSSWTS